ncbi:MAG TPA: hypothetical protein VN516_10660, partial [Candidatus Baltobacteraceae bacterium]|nr:hypothetical protein [Candidatus Baltobacteraceae bacterium]
TITAKVVDPVDGGTGVINPDIMVPLQGEGWFEIRLELVLVGTGILRCEYSWGDRCVGVANNFACFYGEVQVDCNEDFDFVIVANNSDSGTNITAKFSYLEFFQNTGGNPNFGTPTNLVYDEGDEKVTFDFSDYPEPDHWRVWFKQTAGDAWESTENTFNGDLREFDNVNLAFDEWPVYSIRIVGEASDFTTEVTSASQELILFP